MSLIWPLVVLAGLIGWGSAAAALLSRVGGFELRTMADRLVLGVIVAVLVTGLLLAVGEADRLSELALSGVLLAVGFGVLHVRALPAEGRRAAAITTAVGAAVLGVLGVVTASRAAHFDWMPCDDPNYLYLAERFVRRGDLADPGNLRRIQNLGAMSGLQALYLEQLGDRFLPFTDKFLGGAILLTGLWRTSDRRWSGSGIAAASAAVLLYPTFVGLNFNSSPILIPAGLTLLAARHLIALRLESADARATFVRSVLLGLVVATGMAMRAQVGQSLAILVVVVGVLPPFGAVVLQRAVGIATGVIGGLAAWSWASWREAATPLFPLMAGNTDPSFPVFGDRLVPITATELGGRLLEALIFPLWLIVFAVGLAVVIDARRRHPDDRFYGASLQVLGAGIAVCGLWLVAMTIVGWNFGRPADFLITRYFAPLFLGVGVTPLLVLNAAPSRPDRAGQRASMVVATVVVTMSLIAAHGVGDHLRTVADDVSSRRLFERLAVDEYAAISGDYRDAVDAIPPGSKVFSAVDHPSLLLDSDLTVHTLDLVGFASEPPHLRYFEGDGTKQAWLRDHGYEYLVVTVPDQSICNYSPAIATNAAEDESLTAWGRRWYPYVIDWTDYVDRLSSQPGVDRFGSLLVVPLD